MLKLSTLLLALVMGVAPAAARAQSAETTKPPLRLCADPDNLPFSSEVKGNTPGLYIEIGELIGQALGRPVEPVWTRTYFTKHELRTTMLAGKCDAMIGLPLTRDFMGSRVIFTKPLLEVGYAMVTPKPTSPAALDHLKGKRVAVQFSSTPQNLLAEHNDITMVTVLSPEQGMQALATGKADAAILWGPSAGWLNKSMFHDAYNVEPLTGPGGMRWPAAVGLAQSSTELRDAMDGAIEKLHDDIRTLAEKYGLPMATPVALDAIAPHATRER